MFEFPHDSQVISTLYIGTARGSYLAIKVNISPGKVRTAQHSGAFIVSSLIISKTVQHTKCETEGARTQND